MSFTHLHVHSHYSLLDGLPKIPDLIQNVKSLNMSSVALTDHGVMYGLIEFVQQAKKNDIKPILGCEIYVAPGSRFSKTNAADEKPYHLILLAENLTGYKNLLHLVSQAHLEGFYYKPRVDWELLADYSQGLIALTACLHGELPQAILHKRDAVPDVIEKFTKTFGSNNFFLELQSHPKLSDQTIVNNGLIEIAKKYSLPLVATNDVHYLRAEDAEVQDILLCIQTKKQQADQDRMSLMNTDLSLKSPEAMAALFSDTPEAISNTELIAERCNVNLEFGNTLLPKFEVPSGQTPDDLLEEICRQGLIKRYGESPSPESINRLNYELSVIKKMGFASYFLIVQDFVNWSKNNGVMVGPGRGSAAGSIVSYTSNITNIDPLKFELLFERFLNPERISMPDIDLDFADTGRQKVIDYVSAKYGADHVSQIITFGTMAARVAIRDVGRVLGLPYGFCDNIAKLIPMFDSLTEALAEVKELKNLYDSDPQAQNLIDRARKLEGVCRHNSVHACGVLITPTPLTEHVPIQYASGDDKTIVSQYSLHPVEDLGLLKMDFLGLKNLTIIETTLEIIKKTTNQDVLLDNLPIDDLKTFELLQRGETTGVFQLESSGMRRYLIQLKPTHFEDIIAMLSLYRPGPMDFIPDYIAGKHGTKEVTYLHPKLKPILEKTHGIAVYQEQIMEISRSLAGFSYGQADVLRKAVGKKIKTLLDEQEEKMISGMVNNGVDKHVAKKIWEFILPFARYGFNRAHAAAYAMISYQTAYLKAHFPTQFMAALMTADLENTEKISKEIYQAKKMGIQVLPPDINESYRIFTMVVSPETVNQPTIRFGLQAIKNVGEHIAHVIIKERRERGPYQSLDDFLTRVQDKDLNKKSMESLIKAGAFDLFAERGTLLNNLDRILKFTKGQAVDQSSLFSQLKNDQRLSLDPSPPASRQDKLAWERELMGVYISEHPLADFTDNLPKDVLNFQQVFNHEGQGNIRTIGVITKLQKILTKKGSPMVFVTLEDQTGNLEVIVFPDTWAKTQIFWQEGKVVIVEGNLSYKDDTPKLICQTVKIIRAGEVNNLTLDITSIKDKDKLQKLKQILENNPGPCQVTLYYSLANQERVSKNLKTGLDAKAEILDQIAKQIGQINIIYN